MEPIQLGALAVYPFGLIFFGLLIPFFFLCTRQMKKQGLKKETAGWFALLAVPLCFLFARLAFCVLTVDQIIGSEDYFRFFHFSKGGYLLWGAIAGMLLAAKLAGKAAGESGSPVS